MSDVEVNGDTPDGCDAWPVSWPCDVECHDPELVAKIQEAAEAIVWAALGRRHGFCQVTRRIDNESSWASCGAGLWQPAIVDGHIINCPQADRRGCCALRLPHRNVVEVVTVTIGGVEVDESSWFLHADGSLRSVGGCWPVHSQCAESPIVVTYRHGLAPPPGADLAIGEVGCEMLAPYTGGICKLPSRVVSISRNGVSVDLGDPTLLLQAGLWGLPVLDSLIKTYNPNGLTMRSGIVSPDWRMQS